jgi:hypothetical protein
MAKKGFKRNPAAIAKILRTDPAGQAAVRAAAEKIIAKTGDSEAHIEEYQSKDRFVAAVVVGADNQAKHGTATRAANEVANGA